MILGAAAHARHRQHADLGVWAFRADTLSPPAITKQSASAPALFGMQAALQAIAELDTALGKPHPKPKPMALETVFTDAVASTLVPLSAVAGILFALWLWQRVSAIPVRGGAPRSETGREYLLEEEQRGESEVRVDVDHASFPGPWAPCDRPGAASLSHKAWWRRCKLGLGRPAPLTNPPAASPPPSPCRCLQIEEKAADLQQAISEGANSFLFTEYKYVSIFMVSRRTTRQF